MTDTERSVVSRYVDVDGLGDPRRFGFAHAVRTGDLVFLSGFLGIDDQFRPVCDEFEGQAEAAFDNMLRALRAAGLGPESIVSMTLYLTDMGDSGALFRVRQAKLGPVLAASAAVGVAELVLPELKVEVQAVAAGAAQSTDSG